MKKVYCKNCKWITGLGYNYCQPQPFPVSPEIPYDFYFGELETHCGKKPTDEGTIRAYELNRSNDCSYYKCKWWKFWA